MIYAYHSASRTCLNVPASAEKNGLSDGYVQLTDVEYETYFVQPTPENKCLASDENGHPCFIQIMTPQELYEAQVKQVDATRRLLYTNVDALRNEAHMIRMLSTDETKAVDEAKAADYERQAKDLYMKIRDENPWPESPSN